jgi:hypothetical protein
MAEPWIDQTVMIWAGSIGGCLVGLWGAAIGTAGSYLVPRGKAKGLVMTALVVPAVLGVVSLLVGVYAVIVGQPYVIWYPFVLVGFLLSALAIPFVFVMRHRYRQVELRKMQADELG